MKEVVLDIDEIVQMMSNIADAMIKEETKLKQLFNTVYPYMTYEDVAVDGIDHYSECCEVEEEDVVGYEFVIHFYFDEVYTTTVTIGEQLLTCIANETITKDNLDIDLITIEKTDYPSDQTNLMLEIRQIGQASLQSI